MSSAADILNQILKRRGYKTPAARQAFLHPDYEAGHNPKLLPDITPALARLKRAHSAREPLVIYGDYDVDGLSAASLLLDALARLGFKVSAFIPNRYSDGYGLSDESLDKLVNSGARLIITVDTGSTAVEQIARVKAKGVDVIVTDHHEPPADLPPAVAVINPKRADSQYPFRELAGTGVAFKLVQALQSELDGLPSGQEKWLLDLAAIGTVCDVVPLTDENRMLVHWGLRVLAKTRRPGLTALAEVAGVGLDQVTATTLGFGFGPRLNAAGRLEHASLSLDLLTSQDMEAAGLAAVKLDGLNQARQSQQAAIERQAETMAQAQDSQPVIVLSHADWSQGIVGIVASRLLEKFKKPVFIMQILGGTAKGSARSFGQFNLAEALARVRPLLIAGGGHQAAAGYSLKTSDIPKLSSELNRYYRSLKLTGQADYLAAKADLSLADLQDLTLELADALATMAPFGFGNPEPRLAIKDLIFQTGRRVGRESQHLKLRLADRHGQQIEAIAFDQPGQPAAGQPLDVIAKLRRNDFNGRSERELVIEELAGA